MMAAFAAAALTMLGGCKLVFELLRSQNGR